MSSGLDTLEAARQLDAMLDTTVYSRPTTPMKFALFTTTGSAGSAGTEVVGGSYGRVTITGTSAVTGATNVVSNSGVLAFTGMPATTTNSGEIYDNAGTPRRAAFGSLTTSKTTASGDTLSFAAGAVTITKT